MTTKRRKLLALALLAVIGGVIAFPLLRQDDEPTYQGRRLSEWLEPYSRPGSWRYDTETEAAVRNIGTNAVPHLLKWIAYETPAWRRTLLDKLPSFVKRGPDRRWIEGEDYWRAFCAPPGFRFLGTNAASAIPALEALMKDNTKLTSSNRAIYALSYIGEPAIPALKAAFADTNRSDRDRILAVIGFMSGKHNTNSWLPTVVEALDDHDFGVRSMATNVVKEFAPEALTNAAPK